MEDEEIEKDNRFIVDGKKINAGKKSDKYSSSQYGKASGNTVCGCSLSRVLERKINKDTEKHIIIDYIPSAHQPNEKNPFPTAVSMLHSERTTFNSNVEKPKEKKVKEIEPKMIHLEEIQKGLYLGNLDLIEELDQIDECKIKTIINLSMSKLKTNQFVKRRYSRQVAIDGGFLVFNVTFKDVRAITSLQIKELVEQVNVIIETNIDRGNVLVVCENGINKGPVAVVGYAVTKNKCSVERAIDYIDEQKLKNYTQWDNLSNLHLRNCLRSLSPE